MLFVTAMQIWEGTVVQMNSFTNLQVLYFTRGIVYKMITAGEIFSQRAYREENTDRSSDWQYVQGFGSPLTPCWLIPPSVCFGIEDDVERDEVGWVQG